MKLSELPLEKPITIVCHEGEGDVVNDRPDVDTIDVERTLGWARNVTPALWEQLQAFKPFMRLFRCVFPDMELVEGKTLQEYGLGVQHVVGLILVTKKTLLAGRIPHWQYPEAMLHPKHQLGLADLAIAFSKEG